MQLHSNAKHHGRYWLALVVFCAFIVSNATTQKASSLGPAQEGPQDKERLQQLRDTAPKIQSLILRRDVPSLLEYIEKGKDDQMFQEVQRDLSDHNSLLYGRLFDSIVFARYKRGSPPPISVRDYFLRAKDLRVDVSFQGEGADKLQWGYVIYYSSNYPKRSWPKASFFYSDGKWWIRDLFQGDE